MINHIKLNNFDVPEGWLPGDIVAYDAFERKYEPRTNAKKLPVQSAYGKYLEEPILHYTIGTKVNQRIGKELKEAGVPDVLAHDEPPSFDVDVHRMYDHSQLDPDWMHRLSGYHLTKGFLKGVHQGDISSQHGTSYVPSLARAVDFGKNITETGKY
jgi:hypothetical protein